MKRGCLYLVFCAMCCTNLIEAQPLITKGAKVILVVNFSNSGFVAMELFNERNNIEELKKRYPDHCLYVGLFQGGYMLNRNKIEPGKGSLVTIFTDQQPYQKGIHFPSSHLLPGNELDIGKDRSVVISSNKGELILQFK